MAVFLIPFAAIAIGGALAAGAGIGVIEAKKNKAEQAAKLEEAKKSVKNWVARQINMRNRGLFILRFGPTGNTSIIWQVTLIFRRKLSRDLKILTMP